MRFYFRVAMSIFLDSQAQVERDTSGENSEEYDEVSSLIEDSFEDDYYPTLYYRFNNVTKNADEAIEHALQLQPLNRRSK